MNSANNIIYGVQLHPCGQICYFSAGEWPDLKVGSKIVVSIDRGEALVQIVSVISAEDPLPLQGTNPTETNPSTIQETSSYNPDQHSEKTNEYEDENIKTDDKEDGNEHLLQNSSIKNIFIGDPYQWETWEEDEIDPEFSLEEHAAKTYDLCLDPNSENIQPIIRPASNEDFERDKENRVLEEEARSFCIKCAQIHNLDMKLIVAETMLDRSKIIFYFTAPNRIDFRELVKDLVKEYHTRIELRQIGVRNETQKIGAIGNCGMVCCCRRYMRDFAPVTIKMAKEQNLFLNPTKISGTCGRLLCCLAFEQDAYEKFHKLCPKIGKKYNTNRGLFKVLRSNIFRNTLSLLPEQGDEIEVTLEEWENMEPSRQGQFSQNQLSKKGESAKTDRAEPSETKKSQQSLKTDEMDIPASTENPPEHMDENFSIEQKSNMNKYPDEL